MSDVWQIVIRRDTGEAYSVGTVIADPMPSEFVALPLSEADAESLNKGQAAWDSASRSVVMLPPA